MNYWPLLFSLSLSLMLSALMEKKISTIEELQPSRLEGLKKMRSTAITPTMTHGHIGTTTSAHLPSARFLWPRVYSLRPYRLLHSFHNGLLSLGCKCIQVSDPEK